MDKICVSHFSYEHSGHAIECGTLIAFNAVKCCGGIIKFGWKDKRGARHGRSADSYVKVSSVKEKYSEYGQLKLTNDHSKTVE